LGSAAGWQHGKKKSERQQNSCRWDGGADKFPPAFREIGFVNVSQRDEREHQEHSGVGVTRTERVLAQWIVHIPGASVHQENQKTDASVNYGWVNDQDGIRRSGAIRGLA
jgi:hypothetical protein